MGGLVVHYVRQDEIFSGISRIQIPPDVVVQKIFKKLANITYKMVLKDWFEISMH